MKNYIKPTAEVVELSVKESLSDVPVSLNIAPKAFKKATIAATTYNLVISDLKSQTLLQ